MKSESNILIGEISSLMVLRARVNKSPRICDCGTLAASEITEFEMTVNSTKELLIPKCETAIFNLFSIIARITVGYEETDCSSSNDEISSNVRFIYLSKVGIAQV